MTAISKEELSDLQTLKANRVREMEVAFNLCKSFQKMTHDQLKKCGHDGVEWAFLHTIREAQKRIDKLEAAHIKKWPDR